MKFTATIVTCIASSITANAFLAPNVARPVAFQNAPAETSEVLSVRDDATTSLQMSISEELDLPCENDCAIDKYPKLPESVHPGVLSGQAMVDLLNHAKENGKWFAPKALASIISIARSITIAVENTCAIYK